MFPNTHLMLEQFCRIPWATLHQWILHSFEGNGIQELVLDRVQQYSAEVLAIKGWGHGVWYTAEHRFIPNSLPPGARCCSLRKSLGCLGCNIIYKVLLSNTKKFFLLSWRKRVAAETYRSSFDSVTFYIQMYNQDLKSKAKLLHF